MPIKTAKNFYFFSIIVFVVSSLIAVFQGCYGIGTYAVVALMLGTLIISLIFYFTAMYFFEKSETNGANNLTFRVIWIFSYLLSFPFNIFIIFLNIEAIIKGPAHWAFG